MLPFDLRGPAFLAFFLMASLAAAAATIALRWRAARTLRRDEPPEVVAEIAARLHPTEVAVLVSDLGRAVEAAAAGLHHTGLIAVDAAGTLRRTGVPDAAPGEGGVYRSSAARRREPVEAFVLSSLPATVGELCEAARASHLAAVLADRLEREELLVGDARLTALIVRLPALSWIALGAIKLWIGLERGRPVGLLMLVLIAGGALLLHLARPPRRTRLGDEVVRSLTASFELQATAQTAPQQLSAPELSLAYAIFGWAVAPAAMMAVMPSYQAALLGATSGAGGGSSYSSSFSCGSSCGGGGGCGGCS